VLGGILLNLDVVLGNFGMPVVLGGLATGASALSAVRQSMGFYAFAHPGTILVCLGDVLPVEMFGQRALVSVGDILLAVGVIVALASMPSMEKTLAE
jgi:hypothetical protein